MHFVFWNSDLYSDPKKASESSKNDGLIVIGCFISVKPYIESRWSVNKAIVLDRSK